MSLTDMVIMPGADYQDACEAIREKTGGTGYIRSGEMGAMIRGIESGGGGGQYFTLPKGRMHGDADGDGRITFADQDVLMAHLSSTATQTDAAVLWGMDINADGTVSSGDTLIFDRYFLGTATELTSTPTQADFYGNWTYVKVDNLSGYFYYDLPVSGVSADADITVLVSKYAELLIEPICFDGVVRVCASGCPPEDLECCVLVNEASDDLVSTPLYVYNEPDGAKPKIEVINNGAGPVVYFSKNYPAGAIVPSLGTKVDYLEPGEIYGIAYNTDVGELSVTNGGTSARGVYMGGTINITRPSGAGTFTNVRTYIVGSTLRTNTIEIAEIEE